MKRAAVLLSLLSLPALAAQIKQIDLDVTGEIDRPRVLELLGLSEGTEFSEAAFENGLVRVAEGAGRFRSVRGRFHEESGVVTVELRTALRLGTVDVRLEGQGASLDSLRDDLLQASGLTRGDPVSSDVLGEVRERFQVRMSERGFLSSRIVLALEDRGVDAERTLLASVDTGPRSRVTKLSMRGFSQEDTEAVIQRLVQRSQIDQVVDQLPVPRLGRDFADRRKPVAGPLSAAVDIPLDWILLNDSLNRWAQQERSRGYYDFRVSMQILEGKEEVSLGLSLERGPRYDVQFSGNVRYWERDLRTRVTDRSLRLGVPFSLSDAENVLKRLYLASGHKDVRVTSDFRDENGVRRVQLHLDEGRRYLLGTVSFEGATSGDPALLSKVLREWRQAFQNPFERTPFEEKLLQAQLPDLLRRIRALGYLQARILELRPRIVGGSSFVPVDIAVQLGFRARLRSVSVSGNIALPDSAVESLVPFKPGDPANPDLIVEANRTLLLRYQEMGFLDARVEEDEKRILRVVGDGPDVDLELRVEPGPQTRVGQAIVAGNARTKQKVVLRELDADTLGAGALWTPSGQRLLEQRLLGLGIFGGAEIRSTGGRRIDRGDVEKGKVEIQEKDVRIAVNERPAGSVEFGPGFRSDRGVIGFAEVTYRNLGGWNRGVLARAEVSRKIENYQFPEQKYSFAYLEPYLANLRLRLRFGVDYTRRDQITFENGNKKDGFNAEESSFSFLLERQLTERLKLVHNFFTLSLANYTDIQSQNSGLRKYQIGSTGPTFTYDSRDNIFNPTAGWLSNTSFEFSAPAIGSRGNAHYFIGRQALTHYHRVFDRSSVAMLASYSRIRALGGTGNLPEGKRFYMGGSASLRSFSQNALGFEELGVLDQQAMEFKLEYRQPVFLDAGLAFFFDAGRIDVLSPAMLTDVNGATLPRTTGLRKAVGVGLRYTTPVGPLAVDFAYNVDRKPGEANDFKLQFSIGSF